VRAVKAGDPLAIEAAGRLLSHSLARRESALRKGMDRPILIAAPNHLPAVLPTPQERFCARSSLLLPWLEHRPGALVRTRAIRESSTATVRPTVLEHLRTLACTAPFPGAHVILVDDVFTHGRTTDACRKLLLDAGAGSVVIAALGRTRLP
jgi:hypothetical protein